MIGHIVECGVGEGRSARWLAGFSDKIVHGFDSFGGLPEDWQLSNHASYLKGSFAYDVPSSRDGIVYHVGLFADTLPIWSQHYPGMIAFLHFDADLYSSCVTALDCLNHQIVPGTIISFDDMFETDTYKFWEQGEYKAFTEWQEVHNRQVHQLTTGPRGQAAFRILQ